MPRVHLVWAILNIFRETRTNKNISIKLPLRLFDAVVTPTILFGLVSMPLTASDLNQLDAIQRRMLRSLVCMQDEPWRGRMIRMKKCVRPALHYIFMSSKAGNIDLQIKYFHLPQRSLEHVVG